ncbi:hypothetical protein NQ318_001307 [Aromia moschata]|uniref:Uncharacterized protein n=1 Tax=Aromia moschata TaxID=1265417 RepID=A0AAV8ZGQ5_9CUCU|nr:hypothetical protein NQ318_001307 [Aromia moschata]
MGQLLESIRWRDGLAALQSGSECLRFLPVELSQGCIYRKEHRDFAHLRDIIVCKCRKIMAEILARGTNERGNLHLQNFARGKFHANIKKVPSDVVIYGTTRSGVARTESAPRGANKTVVGREPKRFVTGEKAQKKSIVPPVGAGKEDGEQEQLVVGWRPADAPYLLTRRAASDGWEAAASTPVAPPPPWPAPLYQLLRPTCCCTRSASTLVQ